MRFFLISVIVLFFTPICFATEGAKVVLPLEVKHELTSDIPKEIEGKVWNRWTTKNFVICSLDNTQAKHLHKHLEFMKVWIFSRWSLYDVDFSSECKLICVKDSDLFEKMFKIKSTKVEVRRDSNGKIKETVIFLLFDDVMSKVLPSPLTEVCMAEFSEKYNANFGWWSCRGMSLLNEPIEQIRSNLKFNSDDIFLSKKLMETTKQQYNKLSDSNKKLFDRNSMSICLLIRKEFGQNMFHLVLKEYSDGGGESALSVLKFEGYNHFDERTFKRYLVDLMSDLNSKKTPDSYLQVGQLFKEID